MEAPLVDSPVLQKLSEALKSLQAEVFKLRELNSGHNTKITALEQQIEAVRGDNAALREQVGTIHTQLSNQGQERRKLDAKVVTLEREVKSLRGENIALKEQVRNWETSLNGQAQDRQKLDAKLQELEKRQVKPSELQTLASKVDTLESSLKTNVSPSVPVPPSRPESAEDFDKRFEKSMYQFLDELGIELAKIHKEALASSIGIEEVSEMTGKVKFMAILRKMIMNTAKKREEEHETTTTMRRPQIGNGFNGRPMNNGPGRMFHKFYRFNHNGPYPNTNGGYNGGQNDQPRFNGGNGNNMEGPEPPSFRRSNDIWHHRPLYDLQSNPSTPAHGENNPSGHNQRFNGDTAGQSSHPFSQGGKFPRTYGYNQRRNDHSQRQQEDSPVERRSRPISKTRRDAERELSFGSRTTSPNRYSSRSRSRSPPARSSRHQRPPPTMPNEHSMTSDPWQNNV
ncbi:hypothetical protein K474DRAFT_7273 [Panus rudis PR-1116 ss-1]|nr:hypothetical protein K474DRAFT_7273 [Panus rudis PR-1116 ss-1]